MTDTVFLDGHHIGYQFNKYSLGERRVRRTVYDKETRPYCYFQYRKVYLRSVGGSRRYFESTEDQRERT